MQPCQRVPRYELFLSDLMKRTANDHPDYYNLIRAKQEIEKVNLLMDKAVETDNKKKKVEEIQGQLIAFKKTLDHKAKTQSITDPNGNRYYIMEGPLLKVSRKKTHERYFFLFNDLLVHASKVKDKKFNLHQVISLDHCKITEDRIITTQPAERQFQVITDQKSLILVADDALAKEKWVEALQNVFSEIANLRDSEFAPIWKPDSESSQCDLCSSSFSWVVRRHHCRACGSLVCGDCSDESLLLSHISKSKVRVCDDCYERNTGNEAPKKRKRREKETKKSYRQTRRSSNTLPLNKRSTTGSLRTSIYFPPVVSHPPISLPFASSVQSKIIADIINSGTLTCFFNIIKSRKAIFENKS